MKKWTRTVERAAHMIAQDHDTDREIATACKISERTLARWKRDTEFVARVEQIVTEYADRALRHGLARRDRRLRELGDIHQKLQQIATERSQDPDLQKAPGGTTGLLVRRVSSVGSGENFRVFPEYELDAALVREMRGVLDQVAEESGQKITKLESKFEGVVSAQVQRLESPFPFDLNILTDIELAVITEAWSRALATAKAMANNEPLPPPPQEPVYGGAAGYKLVKVPVFLP